MAHGKAELQAYVYVKDGLKGTFRLHKNEGKTYKPTRAEDVSGESPLGIEIRKTSRLWKGALEESP